MAAFSRRDWAEPGSFVLLGGAACFGACIPWLTTEEKLMSGGRASEIVVALTVIAGVFYWVQQTEIVKQEKQRALKDINLDRAARWTLRQEKEAVERSGETSSREYKAVVESLMTYSTIEQRTENAPDTLGQKIRQSLRRIEINIVIGWFLLKVWLVKSLELEKKDDSVVRNVPTYRGRGDHELYIGPSVEELRLKAQSLAAVGLRNSSIPVSNVFGQSCSDEPDAYARRSNDQDSAARVRHLPAAQPHWQFG
jgi:hypothetical protein